MPIGRLLSGRRRSACGRRRNPDAIATPRAFELVNMSPSWLHGTCPMQAAYRLRFACERRTPVTTVAVTSGPGRRRQWSSSEKARFVEASAAPGRSWRRCAAVRGAAEPGRAVVPSPQGGAPDVAGVGTFTCALSARASAWSARFPLPAHATGERPHALARTRPRCPGWCSARGSDPAHAGDILAPDLREDCPAAVASDPPRPRRPRVLAHPQASRGAGILKASA